MTPTFYSIYMTVLKQKHYIRYQSSTKEIYTSPKKYTLYIEGWAYELDTQQC